MKNSFFARHVLATAFLFIFTFCFAAASTMPLTDPPGKKPGIVKTDPTNPTVEFTVNTGPVDEIGNAVRSIAMTNKPATFNLNQESQTVTYSVVNLLRLHNNDLLTNVTATYNLESGASPISLTISTQSRYGQQELWVFPQNQKENRLLGPGSYTNENVETLIADVNLSLSKIKLSGAAPAPSETARSGSLQEKQEKKQ